jgi:hypothetical protein
MRMFANDEDAENGNLQNPLIWWQENEKSFPLIAVLAKKYLCIPATEASSERVFSTASLILTKTRNALSSDHAEDLIFCHDSLGVAESWARDLGLPGLDVNRFGGR